MCCNRRAARRRRRRRRRRKRHLRTRRYIYRIILYSQNKYRENLSILIVHLTSCRKARRELPGARRFLPDHAQSPGALVELGRVCAARFLTNTTILVRVCPVVYMRGFVEVVTAHISTALFLERVTAVIPSRPTKKKVILGEGDNRREKNKGFLRESTIFSSFSPRMQ